MVRAVWAVVVALLSGCAGVGAVDPAQSQLSASAGAIELPGAWRGTFSQTAHVGDSGYIHGNIEIQIAADGTYKGVWITLLTAGSSRGGRMELSGTVAASATRVTLWDSAGFHTTLMRQRDTLYGVMVDPAGKRVHVALDLQKVREKLGERLVR